MPCQGSYGNIYEGGSYDADQVPVRDFGLFEKTAVAPGRANDDSPLLRFYTAERPPVSDTSQHGHPPGEAVLASPFDHFGAVKGNPGYIINDDILHLPDELPSFVDIQSIGTGICNFIKTGVAVSAGIPAALFIVSGYEKISQIVRVQGQVSITQYKAIKIMFGFDFFKEIPQGEAFGNNGYPQHF